METEVCSYSDLPPTPTPLYPQGSVTTAFISNSHYAAGKLNLYHYSLLLLLFLSLRLDTLLIMPETRSDSTH